MGEKHTMYGYFSDPSPCLVSWIDRNMPELGGYRGVRIRCCDRLPFQWLPGFMPTVRGITLWDTIYLKHDCCPIDPTSSDSVELLFHELVHVGQFRRRRISFPVRYLIDLARVGYWSIPAEKEARDRGEELARTYLNERPRVPPSTIFLVAGLRGESATTASNLLTEEVNK